MAQVMSLKKAFAFLAGAWMLVWLVFAYFPCTWRRRRGRNFGLPTPEADTEAATTTPAVYQCEPPEARIICLYLELVARQGISDLEARLGNSAAPRIGC